MNMKVTLGCGNRITIPKDVINNLGWDKGIKLDLQITEAGIVLKPVTESVCAKEDIKASNSNTECKSNRFKRKIVSNLEEGQYFSSKYYSDCGLVIRTKRRYLKDFCEECQGFLVKNSTDKKHICPYISTNTSGNTKKRVSSVTNKVDKRKSGKNDSEELKNNIGILKNQLDSKIKSIQQDNNEECKNLQEVNRQQDKTFQPVSSLKSYQKCSHCGEFIKSGFLIDGNEFLCKKCFSSDFKAFFIKFKKYRKEG